MEELLFTYIEKVKQIHEKESFQKTPEFIQVFGDVDLKEGLKCAPVSNIDFLPANIIMEEEKTTVIDYEWTFFFPIPSQFLVYRLIHYYLESDGKRESLKDLDFYGKAGLTEKDCRVYGEMEKNFQQLYTGKPHSHAQPL